MHIQHGRRGHRKNLGELTEETGLGVTFDPSLKFSRHVGLIVNKANKILGIIKRSFTYMDADMFQVLYKTLVRPHLEYAYCIWNPFLQKDVMLIENVQRRATKIVPGMKFLPYSDRLRRLKIPILAYRGFARRCTHLRAHDFSKSLGFRLHSAV